MYKILTSDNQEHGPFMASVVQQWIDAGKTDELTKVQKVGENTWHPLSEVPEFSGGLAGSSASRAPSSNEGVSSQRSKRPSTTGRTSRLAVASLVLGLLGFTAPLGLVAGVWAQLRLTRSDVPLKGSGIAVAGMVVSGIMLLFGMPVLIGLLVPPWMRQMEARNQTMCLEHAERLTQALGHYADAHDNVYPDMERWCDALLESREIALSEEAYLCPSEKNVRCGFALNEHLQSRPRSEIHGRTVLIFESNYGWNAHGGFSRLANYRHRGEVTVAFVDGSVQAVPVWQIAQLRWLP